MKPLLLATVASLLLATSCSTPTAHGAAAGATHGAFYGAVSSGIVAAVFGGDVGDSIGYGAVAGGTIGGLQGAAAGAQHERRQKQIAEVHSAGQQPQEQTQRNADELRASLIELVGRDNTTAVEFLVDCQHEQAMAKVRRAAVSGNREYRLAALWLEALIALDQGDVKGARAVYPTIVVQDEEIPDAAAAEKEAHQLLTRLEDTRAEFGLPRRCD